MLLQEVAGLLHIMLIFSHGIWADLAELRRIITATLLHNALWFAHVWARLISLFLKARILLPLRHPSNLVIGKGNVDFVF